MPASSDTSKPPVVLTIAGFDPSSGAGITADLQVFAAYGLFGTSCVSVLTVQSTLAVSRTLPLSPDLVEETLRYLTRDLPPVGVKLGMLANAGIVEAVAAVLRDLRSQAPFFIVIDPVLRSSSGRELLDGKGIEALRQSLLPLADCITPNRGELAVLSGCGTSLESASPDQLEHQALILQQQFGATSIIVTGGEAHRPCDLVLQPGAAATWLEGEHIETSSTHGTGCAFSSALLAELVLGNELLTAARKAKVYVEGALRNAPGLGHGRGPLNHHWRAAKPIEKAGPE